MAKCRETSLTVQNPVLSIVVPMYNESENVWPFYERLKKVLDQIGESYEIICVNDGSTDDTIEKLLKLRELDPNVKIIDFSRNFGKEIALTAGIDFSSGEAVIPIDADLQDPPEIIPELVSKWREGYDVVYATRLSREGESYIKRLTATLFYRIAQKVMHINIPKDTGDFRLVSRAVVETLKEMRERNRFMKGLFAWVGFPHSVVYYRREKRHGGKTKWNYWRLWNFALEGITSFSYIPLQIATYFGFVVALLSFVYALFIVIRTLLFGIKVPGYASTITIILFLGGVQLICIGILGEYIGRIYTEVKRRPLYVIRRKYGL
ncbi:MAG: glycosyltransferase family 2 protein [Deltaproteobacteria bacterium]|nr:glycosyltransferase family 2 protein [Deltaproteobacteria bacterium]